MKLLYKIAASILLSIAILLILEVVVYKGLRNNSNSKIDYISNHTINAEILALGACESEKMLDPEVIGKHLQSKVYNLALNHSDYADNYLLLKEYLKYQNKPKAVLLFAIPEAFDSTISNIFNTYRFAHIMKDSSVRSVVKQMDPRFGKYAFLPFIKYSFYSNFIYFKSLSGWKDRLLNDTTSQWPTGFDKPTAIWMLASYTSGPENKTPFNFTWSKSREEYFVKIIQLLKANKIQVIVYHSPIYFEAISLQKNRQQMLNRIDSICVNLGVPYLQFDSLSMRYDRNNYYVSTNPTIPTYNNTIAGNAIFNAYFGRFLKDSFPFLLNQESNKKRLN